MESSMLRRDADTIVKEAIEKVLPNHAVQNILKKQRLSEGKVIVIAVGKAAWQMAKSAVEILNGRVTQGIVITKYHHAPQALPGISVIEAGHPIPDENSVRGADKAISMVRELSAEDTVLFLLSGGGSSLFEKPLIPLEELKNINEQLLRSGADIVEINTVRKRLSAVKGGKFAEMCMPAKVCNVILSDVVGDIPDMIASGPACQDTSTCEQALGIAEKYELKLSKEARACLGRETPKQLDNVEVHVAGNVKALCRAAADSCRKLGYEPYILTTSLSCEAREAGNFLAAIAREKQKTGRALAFLAGGETVVHLKGNGKGGRSQELALAAAAGITGLHHTAVFAVGSDGTDGPTDAAGGFVDGETAGRLKAQGMDIPVVLGENNAYEALKQCGGLMITGPTGTNVNDVAVVLIGR